MNLKNYLYWFYCEIMANFKETPYIFICNNYRFLHNLPIRIGLGHIQVLRENPKLRKEFFKTIGYKEKKGEFSRI